MSKILHFLQGNYIFDLSFLCLASSDEDHQISPSYYINKAMHLFFLSLVINFYFATKHLVNLSGVLNLMWYWYRVTHGYLSSCWFSCLFLFLFFIQVLLLLQHKMCVFCWSLSPPCWVITLSILIVKADSYLLNTKPA